MREKIEACLIDTDYPMCIESEVRKLESDYKELQNKYRKDILNNDIIHRSDIAELENKIDDVILQENQSLKEQIKILAHITYTYNPDVDISKYLHNLSTEDYQLFLENNKTEDYEKLENKLKIAVEALGNVKESWEYLKGGRSYSSTEIDNWLSYPMKQSIDKAREAILLISNIPEEST